MVVIKGLTMPKYCYECPCKIQCKLIDSIDIERPADCPLEEINEEVYNVAVHINRLLYAMPFADAKYIKHGRWIWKGHYLVCSECGEENDRKNYCPNCGAKMDAKGNNNEE